MCVFSSIWTALQSKKKTHLWHKHDLGHADIQTVSHLIGQPVARPTTENTDSRLQYVCVWASVCLLHVQAILCVCVCVSETSPDSSFLWPKSYRPPVFDLYDLGPFISGHVSCHVVVSWSCWGYLRVGARWYLQSDADDQTGHVTV